ncbi:MAG: precorrin-2 C(20)-methyltransferase [Synergistaceae bacterium]|nr:precorrin-2 C(20)-methyltransferase [Synergistaceae bacterium]MBR0034916.1 precorrin-2 C(20)-methyltransferase [Synergistaceae bacterium]
MKLIIAGIGFADLITLRALRAAQNADMILVPRSKDGEQGYAEPFIAELLPERKYRHIHFPMTHDAARRNAEILTQLEAMSGDLENAGSIFFPVIGDAMLYSTGEYLQEAMTELFPDMETEFIPGISAHSLAASIAHRYLAMRDEILAVIPGTAPLSKIMLALDGCECAAIYKPSALLEIEQLADDFRIKNFGHIVRVDYAGIPERERVIEGDKALKNISEYMSIILIWRD